MRKLIAIAALIMFVGTFHSALALDGAAHVQYVGGEHLVTVSGFYIEEIGGEIYDGEISGIIFKCEAIGVCEEEFFYPEEPLPFEPVQNSMGWPEYTAEMTIDPPLDGVAYRYTPIALRPDGSQVAIYHNCDGDQRSYALAGADDIPITRGTLVIDGGYGDDLYFRVESCSPNCWNEEIWTFLNIELVEELSGLEWGDLIDVPIDVFGGRTYCTMPGGDYHYIDRIDISLDSECGPVPVESFSLDSLKARYR